MSVFEDIVSHSDVGMFVFEKGRFSFVNEAFAAVLGYGSANKLLSCGRMLEDWMTPESYAKWVRAHHSQPNEARHRIEADFRRKDGDVVSLAVFTRQVALPAGFRIFGTAVDLTESVWALRELALSEQKYRSLFEYNLSLIYSFDLEGRFKSMNPAVTEALGYRQEELYGKPFAPLIHPDDLPRTLENFNAVKIHGERRSYEARIISKSGEIRHAQIVNIPIYVDQRIVGVYGIANDITNVKHNVQVIERLAHTDYLTNLPNKREFERQCAALFARKAPCSLAILDLDGFKTVNDTLGHDIGDELLKGLARFLEQFSPKRGIFAARLGGDEFALLHAPDEADEMLKISEEILQHLAKPQSVNGFKILLGASIGISRSPDGDIPPLQLLRQADMALYHAKAEGKRRVCVYADDQDHDTLKRFTLVRDMQQAIADGQFFLEYQPRYNAAGKRVTAVEALLRWNHPVWGIVPPGEFIPIAEETGLMVELGIWALQTACREIKPILERWELNLSVNVSGIQIMNKSFLSALQRTLEQEKFPPGRLELEITETVLDRNDSTIMHFLSHLRELDIQVSLDDFGIGYSTLSFLEKHHVSTVKLDKSLLHAVTQNDRSAVILSGIVSLLQSLNINIVTEGIETSEQYEFLKRIHCEEMQGFLFSRPVPASELPNVIHKLAG